MIWKIIGVIVGYIAMSITLFALFSGLYFLLGTTGSFQEGNYNVTITWLLSGLVVFFVGGAIAGFVYSFLAKADSPVIMAGVILVLGILIAISQMVQDPGVTVRDTDQVALMDAMNIARQPLWALIANPVAGFVGAMVGGRKKA